MEWSSSSILVSLAVLVGVLTAVFISLFRFGKISHKHDVETLKQIRRQIKVELDGRGSMGQQVLSLKTNWMLWYASSFHLVWGFLMFFDPPNPGEMDYHGGVCWNVFYELPFSFRWWGALMMLAAVMAAVGTRVRRWKISLPLVLPQQFLLMTAAFGAISHLFGWGHHFSDACLYSAVPVQTLAAIFHTTALIDHYLPSLFTRQRYMKWI